MLFNRHPVVYMLLFLAVAGHTYAFKFQALRPAKLQPFSQLSTRKANAHHSAGGNMRLETGKHQRVEKTSLFKKLFLDKISLLSSYIKSVWGTICLYVTTKLAYISNLVRTKAGPTKGMFTRFYSTADCCVTGRQSDHMMACARDLDIVASLRFLLAQAPHCYFNARDVRILRSILSHPHPHVITYVYLLSTQPPTRAGGTSVSTVLKKL